MAGRIGSFCADRLAWMLGVILVAAAPVLADAPRTVMEWRFDANTKWAGWKPSAAIGNVAFEADHVAFDATGSDPLISGPLFEPKPASNQQWVEIDIDCSLAASGELFYTNKTTGKYEGFEPKWMTPFWLNDPGRQTITVWPFWGALEKIVRLRFDPPSGGRCKLYAIRLMEAQGPGAQPRWTFGEQDDSWRSMHAATLARSKAGLAVTAGKPQTVIITAVEPFDAAKRALLHLDATCPGEKGISLYWATKEEPGFFGQPIGVWVGSCDKPHQVDLRRFPQWKGTITHLAVAFGTHGGEVLTLKSLSIDDVDTSVPFVRFNYLDWDRGVVRPGQDVTVRMMIEHAGGPALPAGDAVVTIDNQLASPRDANGNSKPTESKHVTLPLPRIEPGGRAELRLRYHAEAFGAPIFGLVLPNGQHLTLALLVDIAVLDKDTLKRPADGYDVPVPQPAKTDYTLGAYYFPGWSPEQASRWQKQADFPERDSLLGWYEEGRPEVADWHIKWAVEGGLSFFVYDWYWRKDHEELTAGLNQGFLKARYRDMMKFALMWANHTPFADHTPEQLLQVTDYWIEHYFRLPNYLTVDGKPYVSFFSPYQLLQDLGSPEKTRAALDAMRERARQAGLPGIHFGACAGGDVEYMKTLKAAGFDSQTGYNYRRIGSPMVQAPYLDYMLAHEPIWKRLQAAGTIQYIPLLTMGWDSRPWHGPRAEAQFDRSPSAFEEGLKRLKTHLDSTGGKMAILEAWNEWGEGSYLEPNTEFGFRDLSAIHRVFCSSGPFPSEITPDDLDLGGKYDIRAKLRLHGAVPAVSDGMELVCRYDRVLLTAGTYTLDGRECKTVGGQLTSPPIQTVTIEKLPMTILAGPVESWHNGNRLVISATDRRNILPESYIAGSLQIIDPARPDVKFAAGKDYVIDNMWGAFALTADSQLKPGDKVEATYRYSMRRVDAIAIDADGKPRLIEGKASADCPPLPEVPAGTLHLANIYRPFNAGDIRPVHLYPIEGTLPAPELVHPEAMRPVLDKLKSGQPVTIVCWGDSVTACGESSSPATCYVGLFESQLKERFGDKAIKVVNASIGGSSTPGRLPNFQKEVLDFHPDVVTLEFINDMGLPAQMMQKNYTEILERTRQAGAVLVLITPHFSRPDWMPLTDVHGTDTRANVAFLRKFAHDNGVPVADASRRWDELAHVGVPYEVLLRNGINHPEDYGHRLFAEELMRLFPKP